MKGIEAGEKSRKADDGVRYRHGAGGSRRARSLYQPLDWGLLRAPLLPIDAYLELSRTAVDRDTSGELEEFARRDPLVRTALAVATDDLANALDRSTSSERDARRRRAGILRYLIRMSTRPTPYGLFAGTGLVRWGPATDVAMVDAPFTRTRPDMEWLLSLTMRLEGEPEIRGELRLVANPAAWIHAGRAFLAERAPVSDGPNGATSVSVRASAAVRRALSMSRLPVPYATMKAELLTTPGATPEKVDRVIDELLRQTLLISDLRPPLTSRSPARYVAERLASMSATSARQAHERLDHILEEMSAWDELPMPDRAAGYRDLVSLVNSAQMAQINPPLQVDTALQLTGRQIHREVATEAARAAELLLRLSPWPPALATLSGYRRAFESRYGLEREVALLELLDPGFGLGPPDGHPWQGGGIGQQKSTLRQQALRDIALAALRDRRLVVDLDPDTIAKLEMWSPDPMTAPPSLDVSVFVLARSRQAIDAGEFLIVIGPNLGAPAAGRNLGRFADLFGAEAEAALQGVTRAEAAHRPRHLVAESVYMPHRLRSANVAIRPAIREYEVVSGTMPGVPSDRMIPLSELVVGVRDGRFYVRWPDGGAEVVVCAGHMLNYRQAPAVLRFLEDVGRDGLVQMSAFDWGQAAGFPFLPRVQAGRIVLAPAQWRVDVAMSARELSPEPSATFPDRLEAWRAHWAVPRHVYLSVGDNRLLLDLGSADQAELLRSELTQLKANGSVVLHEPLPGPEHAWAPGAGGGRLTEVVVPVVLGQAPSESPDGSAPAPRALQSAPLSTRMRPPGSEWLFLKLYCPRALDEDLIAGPLRAFCDAVVPAGLADDWFFVRYSDPDPHLRVRFRGGADRMLRHTLPEVCAWASDLMTDGWCQRFGFDSYDREVERYGGAEGMEAAEAIFGADSRAVAEVLHLYAQRLLTLDRTTVAVLSFDDLLAGLGMGERERFQWYRGQVAATAENAKEYRVRQATIRPLLGAPEQLRQQPGGELLAAALTARRVELASVASRLDALQSKGRLQQPRSLLCRSYLHLHHNRLMGGGPPNEDLILGLLRRAREGLDKAPIRQTAETAAKSES